MKVGSIVVVKPFEVNSLLKSYIKWLPVGDEKTMYVIREIYNANEEGHGARFEEGCIGTHPNGTELGIELALLVEVLPPSPLCEEITELTKIPVEV